MLQDDLTDELEKFQWKDLGYYRATQALSSRIEPIHLKQVFLQSSDDPIHLCRNEILGLRQPPLEHLR